MNIIPQFLSQVTRASPAVVTIPPWPGLSSNPVGFSAAPGFSSLTAWPGGTGSQTVSNGTNAQSGSGTTNDPWIFSFYDFDSGPSTTAGTLISASNAKFIGCRFQSNDRANYNVQCTGANITFSYCSVTPRVAVVSAVPFAAWPAASAGLQKTGDGTGYQIGGNSGYQYGLNITAGGPLTADHCDIWGFGNAIVFYTTTAQMTISDCWIHDAADAALQAYHTDGPGYLNGGAPPSNITINHCTIASIGNTNGIAFQAASSAYDNIAVTNCYMSGFGDLVDICHNVASSTRLSFTDNTIATDLPWLFGPLYANFATTFTQASNPTNLWRRNVFKVYPGTSTIGGQTFSWVVGDDGKFVLPNQTLNAIDWAL